MIDGIIMGVITFVWLTNIPIAFLSVVRLLKNRNIFVGKDLRRIHNDPIIIFQITTRSATLTPVVQRGIHSIINSSLKINYSNYQICVITDDPEDIDTLADCQCEVVLVDKKFTTRAIQKGRALQYAVEYRRKTAKNIAKYWVFHMDDESYVTHQTILSLLKSIREGNVLASEGPIFYPLKFESANILTALAESIRPFTCYDCVSQMKNDQCVKSPPLHMHGSNLLVRSDIEDSIGWNFGPTLAEDQMFGYRVYQQYGPKSMGWHGGILLEQPPLNIKDHFMQRRRWIVGSLQNLDKFPPLQKLKLMYKLITYFLGFAVGVVSTIISLNIQIPILLSLSNSLIGIDYKISLHLTSFFDRLLNTVYSQSVIHAFTNAGTFEFGIGLMLLFSSVVWLFSYQVGLFLNLRYSKIRLSKRFMLHMQTLFLCPILGLVETFPAFWAMIEYCIKKKKQIKKDEPNKHPIYDFYVINK